MRVCGRASRHNRKRRHSPSAATGSWLSAQTRTCVGLAGPRTVVTDLEGLRVVPGFNDAHWHLPSRRSARLDDAGSVEVIQQRLRRLLAHAASRAAGSSGVAGCRPTSRTARPTGVTSTRSFPIARSSFATGTDTRRSPIRLRSSWPESHARRRIHRMGGSSTVPTASRPGCSRKRLHRWSRSCYRACRSTTPMSCCCRSWPPPRRWG